MDCSIFERVNARDQGIRGKGRKLKKLETAAEKINEEAFNVFLNKVSFFQ